MLREEKSRAEKYIHISLLPCMVRYTCIYCIIKGAGVDIRLEQQVGSVEDEETSGMQKHKSSRG
jgi:hypothetical protein